MNRTWLEFWAIVLVGVLAIVAVGMVIYADHHRTSVFEVTMPPATVVIEEGSPVTPPPPPAATPAPAATPPTLAVLTADWCGPCHAFERSVLPGVRALLDQRKIRLQIVDVDKQPALAKKLFGDAPHTLPQVVFYQSPPTSQDAKRTPGLLESVQTLGRLIGQHTVDQVRAFLEHPIALSEGRDLTYPMEGKMFQITTTSPNTTTADTPDTLDEARRQRHRRR